MHTDDSDTALVLAAQAGDKEAFARLVGRHRRLLLSLCQRSLADPMLAEDAAQEAVLQALLGIERLRQPDRFGPWLAGIGLNICRRWLRARSRDSWSWQALYGGRLSPDLPDPTPGPDTLAEAAELASHVRRAVADLPRGQQSAVLLFYQSGLTYAETAERLGIEISAVKSRLHKARKTLKRQLSDAWKDEEVGETLSRRTLAKAAGTLTGNAAAERLGPASAQLASNKGESMADQEAVIQFVEMRVDDVRRAPAENGTHARHMAMLREVDGDRLLPIWMGEFEGTAIAMHLERVEAPRPLTFSFAANLLDVAGGQLQEIRINALAESVFYAVAMVEGTEGVRTVDARPSDAINLALITGAPIRVDPAVLASVAADQSALRDARNERLQGSAEIVAELTGNWSRSVPGSSQQC